MVKSRRILVALMAVALLAAGCSRGGGGESTTAGTTGASASGGDFGDLKGICHAGSPKSSPAQGVSASELKVGVFSDIGFTKNPEFSDAAKVFTSWCNDNGGVAGRRLVVDLHDTKMMEVRQRMLEACRDDFALVGGGAALDGLGVKDRLSCLLPDFPAQAVMGTSVGSDLQVGGGESASLPYAPGTGFHRWLLKEAFPASASAVGLINGDSPVTKTMTPKYVEELTAGGATVVYNDLYPAAGVPDWTPYAQAIKSKGVKGLIFLGDFASLAKLEDVLTGMNYTLDWIDTNNNAYTSKFIQLAGSSIAAQHNVADIQGTAPLEQADRIPAVQQVKDLFAKYAPGADVTYPALRAFVAWTLFAKSASACGDALTRKCVYDNAVGERSWTAGGLQAPVDLARTGAALPKCYNIEQATSGGWKAADFKPDTGPFRCDANPYVYQNYPEKPLTLADVGKSLADLK
ncbi:ABC transporter substrate-binding protein [Nocardia sp. BMG111209]|uniref:ABC transporter substrate-binding protein n=1 Tax=Nocardia sp. BMG111209 TaxID=1160137 RepID=UPI0003767142|nr:ABC transporter substrate-binding protein [Nocardia sp. BMG111209]